MADRKRARTLAAVHQKKAGWGRSNKGCQMEWCRETYGMGGNGGSLMDCATWGILLTWSQRFITVFSFSHSYPCVLILPKFYLSTNWCTS